MPEKLIRHSGNYRKLLSYQKTEVIYEMTYYFCHTYLKYGDRTIDQMVQAARSGKQNIVEGCAASSTSAKTEIKLLNVAKEVCRNCSKTISTIFTLATIGNGRRTQKNGWPCENLDVSITIQPSLWRFVALALPKPLQTWQ